MANALKAPLLFAACYLGSVVVSLGLLGVGAAVAGRGSGGLLTVVMLLVGVGALVSWAGGGLALSALSSKVLGLGGVRTATLVSYALVALPSLLVFAFVELVAFNR